MLRSLALIVAAIRLTRPQMPEEDAAVLGRVLQAEAKQRDFDPFTVVAMVHFESAWRPEVVSENGEDYGLGQIRARYVGACRKDEDPLNAPSDACRAEKQRLLDGVENIHAVAVLISESRKLCLQKTGNFTLPRWLASYQGYNFPEKKRWCQPGEKTWRVVKYRQQLVDTLAAPHHPKPPAKR